MEFEPAPRAAALEARLAAFPFANDLSDSSRERLLAVVRAHHFTEDARIVRSGEDCPAVPLVERGVVRVVRLAEKELLLYDVCPGEACVLALTSVLRETPYPAHATAIAGTDALMVPASEMRALFALDPALQRYVVEVFASRFTDLMDLAHEVAFDAIDARLARLLLREAPLHQGLIPMTHAELAAMLGTAREVVSRALDKLQKEGLVELGRRRITIVDADGLRALLG